MAAGEGCLGLPGPTPGARLAAGLKQSQQPGREDKKGFLTLTFSPGKHSQTPPLSTIAPESLESLGRVVCVWQGAFWNHSPASGQPPCSATAALQRQGGISRCFWSWGPALASQDALVLGLWPDAGPPSMKRLLPQTPNPSFWASCCSSWGSLLSPKWEPAMRRVSGTCTLLST